MCLHSNAANRPFSQQPFFGNKVNTGVTNDVTEGTVLFSYRALINVITYTCAQLLFHVKMAAMKKLFIL